MNQSLTLAAFTLVFFLTGCSGLAYQHYLVPESDNGWKTERESNSHATIIFFYSNETNNIVSKSKCGTSYIEASVIPQYVIGVVGPIVPFIPTWDFGQAGWASDKSDLHVKVVDKNDPWMGCPVVQIGVDANTVISPKQKHNDPMKYQWNCDYEIDRKIYDVATASIKLKFKACETNFLNYKRDYFMGACILCWPVL